MLLGTEHPYHWVCPTAYSTLASPFQVFSLGMEFRGIGMLPEKNLNWECLTWEFWELT